MPFPLPAELLLRTLELAIEAKETIVGRIASWDTEVAYPILLAASLVSKEWRNPAQSLLRRGVTISSKSGARRFLASPDARRDTMRLLIINKGRNANRVTADIAGRVIAGSSGLQELAVINIAGFEAHHLYHPSVSGVTYLLLTCDFKLGKLPLPIAPALTSLQLSFHSFDLDALTPLLANSALSITTLSIPYRERNFATLCGIFHILASHLTTLELFWVDADRPTPFLPILTQCTALRNLQIAGNSLSLLPTAVAFLPRPLHTLRLSVGAGTVVVVPALALPCFNGLRKLEVSGMTTQESRLFSEILVQSCRERLIELVFLPY